MMHIPDYQNGFRVITTKRDDGGLICRVAVRHENKQRGVDIKCSSLEDDFSKPLSALNAMIVKWPQHPVTAEQVRDFKG